MRQILMNLLNNAIKFTAEGGVSLLCALESSAEDTVVLRFTVTDTGIGMSKETLKRVFTPFEQADGSISKRHGGTGLGLAIVKTLVEMLGGEVGVTNRLRRGSEFTFTCKVVELAEGMVETPSHAKGVPHLAAKSILLVEDNEINREIALALLDETKADITVAKNGLEALLLVKSLPPFDLILMDVQMPIMDGIQATRKIHAVPGMAEVPIVAMTAHALDTERKKCLEAGMKAHIGKPLDIHSFYDVIASMFKEHANG